MEDQAEQGGKAGGYREALARFAAKLRLSPRADWDSIAIVTGRIWITRYRTGTRYLLFTTDAVMRVRWRCADPPPGLQSGQRICVYGKISTQKLGSGLTISQALTVKVKKSIVKRMLTTLFDKIGLPVAEYDDFAAQHETLPSARQPRRSRENLPEWMTPALDEDESKG